MQVVELVDRYDEACVPSNYVASLQDKTRFIQDGVTDKTCTRTLTVSLKFPSEFLILVIMCTGTSHLVLVYVLIPSFTLIFLGSEEDEATCFSVLSARQFLSEPSTVGIVFFHNLNSKDGT